MKNKTFAFTVVFINFKDVLLAIYLYLLWIRSSSTNEEYILQEDMWKSDVICFSSFSAMALFSVLSIIGPIFLAVSRLLVIVYPMDSKFKSTVYSMKLLLSIHMLSLVFTLILTLTFQITKNSLPIYLCFPFIDPTKSEKILNVLTIFFSVGHIGAFMLTTILYFILVKKVKETQKNVRKSKSEELHIFLIIQIVIFSVSNFICWKRV